MGWSFIGNVVIHCPGGRWVEEEQRVEGAPREIGAFYAELLGLSIIRDDWIKVGKDRLTFPQIAIDGVADEAAYLAPKWPDPARPAQLHLHLTARDLETSHERILRRGGALLAEQGESRVYEDPAGHPFCLTQAEEARIESVVIDCGSPKDLAPFYEALLDLQRTLDRPDRVALAREGAGPSLVLQQVEGYQPPSTSDDTRHQQVHLDLWFEDIDQAERTARDHGGTRLSPPDRHAIYSDPAGHPLCLLRLGQ